MASKLAELMRGKTKPHRRHPIISVTAGTIALNPFSGL